MGGNNCIWENNCIWADPEEASLVEKTESVKADDLTTVEGWEVAKGD